MFAKCKIAVLSLALVSILAPLSRADGFGITLMKKIHHGALSIGFSTGSFWGGEPETRCQPAVWIPGHYETVYRQVWIEGCVERVWMPPVYERQYYGCNRPYRACVRGGGFQVVRGNGHFETRPVQVWVEGGWR